MNMDMIFDVYPNESHLFDYDTYFGSGMKCEPGGDQLPDRESGIL